MHTITISNTHGQRTKDFKTLSQVTRYLLNIPNVSLSHVDNEKIYIETSDGYSYEYFKQNYHETYLWDIFPHYFDSDDLNKDKWFYGGNGDWFTFDKMEITWFEQLSDAYSNLSQEELETIPFNDYDDIIDYYNGKKAN